MLSHDHFDRLIRLLELESQAEARQMLDRMQRRSVAEAEAAGLWLAALVVQDEYAGLGGRCILTLSKRNHAPLPWTRLGTGTPVLLSEQGARAGDGWRAFLQTIGDLRYSEWPADLARARLWYEPHLHRIHEDADTRSADLIQLEQAYKTPNLTAAATSALDEAKTKALAAFKTDDDDTCHKAIADGMTKAGMTLK